jgi:truncated hemoglobin YjbI
MGLTHEHFDRVLKLFSETLEELQVSEKEREGMLAILESSRDDVLGR